ncbi:hypothetical protein CROQUDRAFT_725495 [Cronartium quercuum f. sp. fusiforme G11]|uniref:DH domain-containing protein n=1 Tax=Cronartium quercuum f. sp. fusiforme G11 TaxID=708437 RepID=A0A9P6T766_9BASI|nr:hypothetical protein CROQUDRAFT_725495 [Cronartium quercuum f. sp. fusiforme G11]
MQSSLSLSISPSPTPGFIHDLLGSERAYLADLMVIIKRIAAAYSPQNFPPPHLDHHFRLTEAVFRSNKALLNSILALGPNLDHRDPVQLANLMAGWIYDLEPIYGRYCSPRGWAGAGGWSRDPSVMSNPILRDILATTPWPASLAPPPAEIFPGVPYPHDDIWTIDKQGVPHATLTTFFALPFARLVYYRRLYEKVLKTCQHGSPEHRVVQDASTRLSNLLDAGCLQWNINPIPPHHARSSFEVSHHQPPSMSPPGSVSEPRQLTLRTSTETTHSGPQARSASFASAPDDLSDRSNPSTPFSSPSGSTEGKTALGRRMVEIRQGIYVQQAVLDLERTLDTSQCLDIFTMTPKPCRLHMAPPDLAFSRTIRHAGNASFFFQPQSNPSSPVATPAGRLILLTDLLLFCERAETDSKPCGAEAWLMYPPLAGKHLRVCRSEHDECQFEVFIMRKERVLVTVSSRVERDHWILVLEEAIDHGSIRPQEIPAVGPTSRGPPKLNMNTTDLSFRQTSAPPSPAPVSGVKGSSRLTPANSRRQTPVDDFQRQQPHSPLPRSPASTSFAHSPSSRDGPALGDPRVRPGGARSPDQPHHQAFAPLTGPPTDVKFMAGGRYAPMPTADLRAPVGLPTGPPEPCLPRGHPSDPNFSRQLASTTVTHRPLAHVGAQSMPPVQRRGWQLNDDIGVHSTGPRSEYAPSSRSMTSHPSARLPSPPGSGGPRPTQGSPRALRKAPSAHALGQPPPPDPHRAPPLPIHTGGGGGRDGALLSPCVGLDIRRPASTDPSPRHYRSPSSLVCDHSSASRSPSSHSIAPPSQRSSAFSNSPSNPLGNPHWTQAPTYDDDDDGPVTEPVPTHSTLVASMKTKVFLKQGHAQWKALGTAKLMVFTQNPGNVKQLVVEQEKDSKTMISTIVLTDGVERVGRTGVAVDLSDTGRRTGIVYMLQVSNNIEGR